MATPIKSKAIDVADYILKKRGGMSAMKLQKLVYYSQAWTLVWTDNALFSEEIEAWADGPVVRKLYHKHRGHFRVEKGFFGGDPAILDVDKRNAVDKVLAFYGEKDAQWLSNLTHLERPWVKAREGLMPGDRGRNIISKESMLSYYSSL
jgi:uncharacterized phage-associated protein